MVYSILRNEVSGQMPLELSLHRDERHFSSDSFISYSLFGVPLFSVPLLPKELHKVALERFAPLTLKRRFARKAIGVCAWLNLGERIGKVDSPATKDAFGFDLPTWLSRIQKKYP